MTNRSAPPSSVIPVLRYPDILAVAAWLKQAYGFRERLRIGGNHRIQMHAAGGHIVLHQAEVEPARSVSIMIRTDRIDDLFEAAVSFGAVALEAPRTHMFGERQCTLQDPFGQVWNFTQTVEDIDPASWGGEAVEL
jgi:uncharacterized glyoxalase superfamily protein PhnB